MRSAPPVPLGATWDEAGATFAVFSARATRIDLCLFDRRDDVVESSRVPLVRDDTGVWQAHVNGIKPGQLYGYRAHGPWQPDDGDWFNPQKLLLDPYTRAIGRSLVHHPSLFAAGLADDSADSTAAQLPDPRDSAAYAPLGAVIDPAFDWQHDEPPGVPWSDTLIYELHVKGFTAQHPDVPPALRGTYLGVASPPAIAHLLRLGVTTVELLPVFAHADEFPLAARGLTNYWGYNTLAFFAPDPRFASDEDPATAIREFKTMVRGLHEAGIEVVLDVVYNHTSEGNQHGPMISMRGLDNRAYYRLVPGRPAEYEDFSGCGNTLDMSSSVAMQLMIDSLVYWTREMHVDGFRFDLAPALARGAEGVHRLDEVFARIAREPALDGVKLIAEPWDARAGGMQLGGFPPPWREWNGRYRDAVRRFWRGDTGVLAEFATRVAGSSDLFGHEDRGPLASVNFVIAHDGFTLADLVSYADKHNEANGEDNRDGESHNASWNGGVEGPSSDPAILEQRARDRRNLLTTLLLSLGVPMICGGDERLRTQEGNNNAYCHDSPLTWTPWTPGIEVDVEQHFVERVSALRAELTAVRSHAFLSGGPVGEADVHWLATTGLEMSPDDWHDPGRHTLAMWLPHEGLLILFNASADAAEFVLPVPLQEDARWVAELDTGKLVSDPLAIGLMNRWRVPGRALSVLRSRVPSEAEPTRP